MTTLSRILICDDDSTFHLSVKYALKGGFDFTSSYNADEAITLIKKTPFDILLLDIQMRTKDEGIRYLPRIRETDPNLAVIMTSGLSDYRSVSESLKAGAVDYVTKDFGPEELKHRIETVLRQRKLISRIKVKDSETLRDQKQNQLIGDSRAISDLRRKIEKLRNSKANILITGETGVGKEVVARLLRETLSDGTLAPFISIDSSTIQSSTAESILFGHEKGAFTGADRQAKGIFEEADGGTVYFDEIGNMPVEIQSKLLRVLQEKEVIRLGSSKPIQLDFRIIAATNRDLGQMTRTGDFKVDLLQRIEVIPIHIPPLRDRVDDIPLLVDFFCKRNAPAGRVVSFSQEALRVLSFYSWPGNIRELNNIVAYVIAMSDSETIEVADLPPKLREKAALSHQLSVETSKSETAQKNHPQPKVDIPHSLLSSGTLFDRMEAVEKAILSSEFDSCEGNVSTMALRLGVDRSHLYSKLREHGLYIQKKSRTKESRS